jgi:hypothetical protein
MNADIIWIAIIALVTLSGMFVGLTRFRKG